MKRKIISLILVVTTLLCSSSVFAGVGFSDVSMSHWAVQYIWNAQVMNIVNGYEDGTFRPENKVKVGEFIKMIVSLKWEIDTTEELPEGTHWATPYAKKAASALILYEPAYDYETYEKYITREEAVELMWKMYKVLNISVKADDTEEYIKRYSDESLVTSIFRREYFNSAIKYGLINGFEDGTLRPKETLTRAQAAKLICGIGGKDYEKYKKID